MVTLLCRRFELARSGGERLQEMEVSVQAHVAACQSCQQALRLEARIGAAISAHAARLPAEARARIEAVVAVKSRPHHRRSASTIAAVVVAVAAALTIVMIGPNLTGAAPSTPQPAASSLSVAPSARGPEEGAAFTARALEQDAPTSAALANTEPISGLRRLVDRHLGRSASSDVPLAGLLYEAKLPYGLANQLLFHQDAVRTAWDGLPPVREVNDATLFVLARDRITLDPVIAEVLAEAGTLTLPFGPHQITIAPRDHRLFVIIADPAGIHRVASHL